MSSITVQLDDHLLQAGQNYARQHGTTLDEIIREMLEQRLVRNRGEYLQQAFDLADRLKCKSDGPWKREDLYDV